MKPALVAFRKAVSDIHLPLRNRNCVAEVARREWLRGGNG